MRIHGSSAAAIILGAALSLSSVHAAEPEITVGFITGMTGPAATIGLPISRGLAAGIAYRAHPEGARVRLIQLDDASDPSIAARNARKLIEEEKVDIIIGSSAAPSSLAIAAVAHEARVPQISLGNADLPGEAGSWMITIPQPPALMVRAVVDRMKKEGVRTVGFIGFNDSWGDLVYDGLQKSIEGSDIKIVANERYARADTTVTAQVLKVMAQRPDAVLTGGAGSPGALPHIGLAERGYKGKVYSTHALVSPDVVRVGGSSMEGLIAPTGPVVVADQLADSNPIKPVALAFKQAYMKAHKTTVSDNFAAYGFDAWLVFLDVAKRALATGATPGTAEFRNRMHEAMVNTKEVVGVHAVYNFRPDARYGVDERARVLVRHEKGDWKLLQD